MKDFGHFTGCSNLTDLGEYEWHGRKFNLLHVAGEPGSEYEELDTTLAAQWGPQGDYMSGLPFGWISDEPDHPLVVARIRAEEKGLYVGRDKYAKTIRHSSGILITPDQQEDADKLFGETENGKNESPTSS